MGRILKNQKKEKSKSAERRERLNLVQMVVEIPWSLDVRLESMAAFKKMERSDLVRECCDQVLRRTDFDKIVRSALPDSELHTEEDPETLPLKLEGSGKVDEPPLPHVERGRGRVAK